MADPTVVIQPQQRPWYEEPNETLAIFGVLLIAVVSMYACKADVSAQIASNVVSGLIGYMGRGRINGK